MHLLAAHLQPPMCLHRRCTEAWVMHQLCISFQSSNQQVSSSQAVRSLPLQKPAKVKALDVRGVEQRLHKAWGKLHRTELQPACRLHAVGWSKQPNSPCQTPRCMSTHAQAYHFILPLQTQLVRHHQQSPAMSCPGQSKLQGLQSILLRTVMVSEAQAEGTLQELWMVRGRDVGAMLQTMHARATPWSTWQPQQLQPLQACQVCFCSTPLLE